MKKQIKQRHRGITWQHAWDPNPALVLPRLKFIPFEPEKHIKGYGSLWAIRDSARQEMMRYQGYVAYEAAVMTDGLRDKTRAEYLEALAAYERAEEILEQVYVAYTGEEP